MEPMTNGGRQRVGASARKAASAVIVAMLAPVALLASIALSSQPASAAPGVSAAATIPGGGQPAPNQGVGNLPRTGKGESNSLDWAGYAVTGTPVTSVAGSWVEPTAVCPVSKVEQSAFWVGIDGYAATDPTVQQIGTDADCTKKVKKVPGGPSYYAWFEMYPQGLVVLPTGIYPVAPGDVLSASVTVVGSSSYTLAIADAGRWTYSTTQVAGTTVPLNASAEWIAEAPTSCVASKCKVLPLADFGSVVFSGATVNRLAINATGLTDNLITMTKTIKGKTVKASTSALDVTGHSFTVTWLTN
jgi:hypothetical protein